MNCVENHDLCIEVTTDNEDDNIVIMRETDPAFGSGPDVWLRTSRENFGAFADAVKGGEYDDLYPHS